MYLSQRQRAHHLDDLFDVATADVLPEHLSGGDLEPLGDLPDDAAEGDDLPQEPPRTAEQRWADYLIEERILRGE